MYIFAVLIAMYGCPRQDLVSYFMCAVIPDSNYTSVLWTTWCVSLLYVESAVQNIQRLNGPTFIAEINVKTEYSTDW